MTSVDWIVVGFIGLLMVLGLIRGIVSQIMALAGLALAYIFAPLFGDLLGPWVRSILGSSLFMAEKVAILVSGIGIYIASRVAGYLIEKGFVNRVGEFKKLNRLGGGALGGVKACVLVAIIFFFLALIPSRALRDWAPNISGSMTYRLASRFNPMGKPQIMERMAVLRKVISDPKKRERLTDNPKVEEILKKYEMESALKDNRFVEQVKEGDYDGLRRNEQIESMMKDDELAKVLDQLAQTEVRE